jgi:8-oxo-dGTP pyrophosphatase MutT (NUDIX family)
MHRQWLTQKLAEYQPFNQEERNDYDSLKEFVSATPNCFDRYFYTPGHITGSAWIVSPDLQKVVLHHHRKLKKWIQPGGHSDNHPITLEVALQEAQEETGLKSLHPLSENIFDLSIRNFPERSDQPAHLHYDLRFLFQADPTEPFQPAAEESQILLWIPLNKIPNYNNQSNILRMVEKTKNYPSN